jgi:hypothetical protein
VERRRQSGSQWGALRRQQEKWSKAARARGRRREGSTCLVKKDFPLM